MPFKRPTITELNDRIKGDIEASIEQNTPILKKAVLWVLAKVFAGAVHLLFGFLDFLSRQIMPDTAESEYLERWADIWGVTRKPSTFAEYDIQIDGTESAVLTAGSIFSSVNEIEYETLSEVTITEGVATVHIRATTSGSVGNLETDDNVELVNPVAGINSIATVLSTNQLSGVDEEDDEDLRIRLLERIQNSPQGGSVNDYIRWAKEVAGVTRVWVYSNWMGPGTVGVTFVTDDDPDSIIPGTALVTEVQEYIDDPDRKPINADVTVFAPTEKTLNFTITIDPDTTEIRDAVQEELTDLIFREATPGNILRLSKIREAVSGASGEEDNDITFPAGDVTIANNEIGVLGTITWV